MHSTQENVDQSCCLPGSIALPMMLDFRFSAVLVYMCCCDSSGIDSGRPRDSGIEMGMCCKDLPAYNSPMASSHMLSPPLSFRCGVLALVPPPSSMAILAFLVAHPYVRTTITDRRYQGTRTPLVACLSQLHSYTVRRLSPLPLSKLPPSSP